MNMQNNQLQTQTNPTFEKYMGMNPDRNLLHFVT
jgi:hypothetical protein